MWSQTFTVIQYFFFVHIIIDAVWWFFFLFSQLFLSLERSLLIFFSPEGRIVLFFIFDELVTWIHHMFNVILLVDVSGFYLYTFLFQLFFSTNYRISYGNYRLNILKKKSYFFFNSRWSCVFFCVFLSFDGFKCRFVP